jgi:hypothetical protein
MSDGAVALNIQRLAIELMTASQSVVGLEILEEHGLGSEGLAADCLRQVRAAAAVFAWIDRADTIGTIAELAAAHVLGIPFFIAFATEELQDRFYFVQHLARVSVIAADVNAWHAFTRWRP